MPKPPREESDTSLSMLDGLRRGDNAAWTRFVTVFSPLLYQKCRGKGHSEEDSRDIVQETFIKIQQSFPTFVRNGRDLRFRFWLNSVVQSVRMDYGRRRARQFQAQGGEAQAMLEQYADPLDILETDEDQTLLFVRALDTVKQDFTPNVWEGFRLTEIEGWSTKETAKLLETTEGAIRSGNTRIRKRLRDELEGLLD